jgi:DNA-binding NarL/FixJ family response regulator
VLIVEDDELLGIALQDALTDAAYDAVGIAASGEAAISLAIAQRPDIILMDIGLPGRADGVSAAAKFWNTRASTAYFATGQTDPVTRTRGAVVQPLGWVAKPYDNDEIVRALDLALTAVGSRSARSGE